MNQRIVARVQAARSAFADFLKGLLQLSGTAGG